MSRLSAPHPQISFSATLFTSLARSMTLFDVFLFSPNSSDKLSSCPTPSQRSLIHNWKIAANALYKKRSENIIGKWNLKSIYFSSSWLCSFSLSSSHFPPKPVSISETETKWKNGSCSGQKFWKLRQEVKGEQLQISRCITPKVRQIWFIFQ